MTNDMKKLLSAAAAIILVFSGLAIYYFGRSGWVPVYQKVVGKRTVAEAVSEFGPAAELKLSNAFEEAGVAYPPSKVTLIGLKEEKRIELWADNESQWVLVKNYEVKKASGTSGPKLTEGDWQVPEGFYEIEGLNPNSSYHLSLKLNYPNEFDHRNAEAEGRTKLGGDIFIHGKAVSVGCLAIGDEAIEELFVLTERIGKNNIFVIIVPWDFRHRKPTSHAKPWVNELYSSLEKDLLKFPLKTH